MSNEPGSEDMTPYQFSGGLALTAGFILALCWLFGPPSKPSPDQLYGCAAKQEAPNGECK